MSKKHHNMTAGEICRIGSDYFQALKLAKGQAAVDQTNLTCKGGWFYLWGPGVSPATLAIPRSKQEIQRLTAELQRQIPQRKDSDSEGEPD